MNSPKSLFGTDGIRGLFGVAPLDRPTVTALGLALGQHLNQQSKQPLVVMGGDTRNSTPVLASWLAAGLASDGCQIHYAGTVPTPAVAYLTRTLGAALGIAISASHNPPPDNGIKLIDPAGFKWSPSAEAALEVVLQSLMAGSSTPITSVESADQHESPEDLELVEDARLTTSYLDLLRHLLPGDRRLAGLRVALDTANGAATGLAKQLFAALGASVETLGDSPNGRNINLDCGSTQPEAIAEVIRSSSFDLGFAFDGDADRVIPVDGRGRIHDGDAILYLLARDLFAQGALEPPRIVATTMSNLGLEVALTREGIGIERCDVGDRVVVQALRDQELVLGGEQSGHIIYLRHSTTGDGLLTAMLLADLVARKGRPLSELLRGFERYPQVLVNVRVQSKPNLRELPAVETAAREVEHELGSHGRLVLRYSGTEPLARVMIEGPKLEQIERLAKHLITAIDDAIGVTSSSSPAV